VLGDKDGIQDQVAKPGLKSHNLLFFVLVKQYQKTA
jgi:hypothetical protein